MFKKISLVLALLAAGVPARAGIYYDLQQSASSATLRMVGVAKWWASTFSGSPTIIADGATGIVTATTFSGNATSATNVAGGAAGSMPYQTGSGATSFITSAAGKLLSIVGTTPTWLTYLPTTVSVSTANVSPGMNGASQLVQLNSSTQYPALDGSLITNLTGVLSGGATTAYPKWTSSTTLGNSFVSEVSSGVTISSQTNIIGSTFTVQSNGVVDFGSQPSACFTLTSGKNFVSAQTAVFWSAAEFQQNISWVSTSSDTITIPTGAGGVYSIKFLMDMSLNATGSFVQLDVTKNGSAVLNKSYAWSAQATNQGIELDSDLKLAAGDVIKGRVGTDNLAHTSAGDGTASRFCLRKY